ncbi:MAG: TetR/AcrR family transcriptional regulator, partial [Syntrophaceticus sp.]|nr:TetR/AcrR family transcriptional regulator [Syntrophaceticus sp.]MDD4783662.1 TetR/AcrR family transcriptional regulator [Syntrophaceticus sp.]
CRQIYSSPDPLISSDLYGGERMSKKKTIIDAAAFLFAEKGYYAATVEEIASQAGIGKSTVYGHFPSKDHILQDVLKCGCTIYMDAMKGRLKPPCSVRDVLIAVATAHFTFNKEYPYIARILADEFGSYPLWAAELLQQLRERRISMFSSLLSQGINLGEFRQLDPRLGAEVFLSILNALCMPIFHGMGNEKGSVETGMRETNMSAETNMLTESNIIEGRFYHGIDIFFSGVSCQEPAMNISV